MKISTKRLNDDYFDWRRGVLLHFIVLSFLIKINLALRLGKLEYHPFNYPSSLIYHIFNKKITKLKIKQTLVIITYCFTFI